MKLTAHDAQAIGQLCQVLQEAYNDLESEFWIKEATVMYGEGTEPVARFTISDDWYEIELLGEVSDES